MLNPSDSWKTTYPDAVAGILVMRGVANPTHHPRLDQRITAWEAELRKALSGSDRATLRALPVLQAYAAYYRRFRKTYHVELQLESVLLKGRAMPRSPALVAAMVAAELKNLLLTAGHDLEVIEPPVTLDLATGGAR
jgi:DNA/RNA-binding domain of Phe-tRNA-synthetase-like protein